MRNGQLGKFTRGLDRAAQPVNHQYNGEPALIINGSFGGTMFNFTKTLTHFLALHAAATGSGAQECSGTDRKSVV